MRAEGKTPTIKILNADEIFKHIHHLYYLEDAEKILDLYPPLPIIQISNEEGKPISETQMTAALWFGHSGLGVPSSLGISSFVISYSSRV